MVDLPGESQKEAVERDNKPKTKEFPAVAEFEDALPQSKRGRGTRQDYLNWTGGLIRDFKDTSYSQDYDSKFSMAFLNTIAILREEVENNLNEVKNSETIASEVKLIVDELLEKWDAFSDKFLPFISNPEIANDYAIGNLFKEINRFNKQIGEIRRLIELRYHSSWSEGSGPGNVLTRNVPLTNDTVIFELLSAIHKHKTSPIEKTVLMLSSVLGVLDERCGNLSTTLTYFQFGRGHFMREKGQKSLYDLFGKWRSVHNQCRDAKDFIEKRMAMNHILDVAEPIDTDLMPDSADSAEVAGSEKADETKE